MLTMADGGGPVKAMCLSKGPLANQYTTERQHCEAWASGHLGAVDTPDEEPPDYESADAVQAARAAAGCRTCSECVGDPHHWIEHGDDPELRIALCGYAGEHEMPATWTEHAWKAARGYSGEGNNNRERERIWFSPHCLPIEQQRTLFGAT